MTTLESVEVSGTPQAMGRAYGEHFREKIKKFVQVRFDYLAYYAKIRGRPHTNGILDIGKKSMEVAAQWDPEGHAEHLGVSEGCGIDPITLYTATNLTDMRDVLLYNDTYAQPPWDEGCSSVLIPGSHTAHGHAVAGQTWDLNALDVEYVVAVRRNPTEGPRTWSVTCAGCLTLIGINEEGICLGTTNIKAHGAAPGAGYLTILHRAIRSKTFEEASEVIEHAPRAGAHTYWLSDATQQLEWEAVPGAQNKRTTQDGPIWRTNHCLYPPFVERQAEEGNASSHARFAKLNTLLPTRKDHTVEGLKEIFADRSDGAMSINRYAEDDLVVATNAVFVASPHERRAYACRSNADRGTWKVLDFD